MIRDDDVPALDFDRYPRTENYFVKRGAAYVADVALSFLGALILVLVFGADLGSFVWWVVLYILTGLISLVYMTIAEAMGPYTVGKKVFSLAVIGRYEDLSIGESLGRNISLMLPFIGPGIDQLLGSGTAKDPRQKLADHLTQTLVIEEGIELVVERPRPVFIPSGPKEKMFLDYRNIRVGNCPRCGAPYRVLAPGDTSFSGLWNHRCTWCNHLIQESD